MSLYEIIKALQNAQGSLAKQAILMQHKDNELLKEYMRAVYDPSINFYQRKAPVPSYVYEDNLEIVNIKGIVHMLSDRIVTGHKAKDWLKREMEVFNAEGQELIKLMIDRSIGASVGDMMILKTWPDLYFTVPYQRCSLLDDKAKYKFSKLPLMYVQEKCDGSFLYLVKEAGKPAEAITRAGSRYPKEFAEKLAEGVPDGVVLIGELLVYEDVSTHGDYVMLDRQTGNGMLNSILKGGNVDKNFDYEMKAWDILTPAEFKAGKSETVYFDRLSKLFCMYDFYQPEHVQPLKNKAVKTLEEAYVIYSKFTSQGKEGAVLKTPDFIWKDGTSKDCVKMKVEFEIDLEVVEIVEGTGKASGMMGAVKLKSSCGKLLTDVGTGFSDQQRKHIWEFGLPKIVAIKANDIISKRGSDTFSCFLPVFVEERLDKTEADSYDDCVAILNAAKGLK